jgi:pyruvate-ferredoxin/flavodoxin oxidoreductase
LIDKAQFIGCHQPQFVETIDFLEHAAEGAHVLLNTPHGPDEVWAKLPQEVQLALIEKRLRLHVIDAYSVAHEAGVGRLTNTIMQVCFFEISKVLGDEDASVAIKEAIDKTYSRKGPEIVRRNFAAVDAALSHLCEVAIPSQADANRTRPPVVPKEAPEFVQRVTATIMAGQGDLLPVSAFPIDGTWPLGTTRWEKSNLASEIPVWETDVCIQCNKCALVCPHAAIRA